MHGIGGDQDGSGSGGGRSGASMQLRAVDVNGGGGRGAHRRAGMADLRGVPCSTSGARWGRTGSIGGGFFGGFGALVLDR